jgi:flavin reductase (DIM6/NTAB) family NADH-FMN oxidoreductase RutF
MKEIPVVTSSNSILERLKKGAFLTTMVNGKVNTMIIGWGSIGIMWRKPVFVVMVRGSRYSHELLEQSEEFTITFPGEGMDEAVKFCGSRSGRNIDKLIECELKTISGFKVTTPLIHCDDGIYLECKVIYRQDMVSENMSTAISGIYTDIDFHTMYFGEILASYTL